MANTTYVGTIELTVINCGVCGGSYSISERYRKKCEEDESYWHCPYCQTSWGYVGSTEKQRLKNEISSLKRQKQWAEDDAEFHRKDAAKKEQQRRAQKGANTRLKKRIACGSCPCCKRNFKDLRRHMQSQHPDFDQAEA